MFKVLLTCCTKSATKAGSLSEPMLVKVKSLSRVRLFATLWTEAYQLLRPWGFPGKSTGVGCHFLLQEIFPTQGLNPGLLHCRQMLYCFSHQLSHTKAGSLSEPMLVGSPNLGTISLSRHRATSDALSVQVGKSSTHPENVYNMTSR